MNILILMSVFVLSFRMTNGFRNRFYANENQISKMYTGILILASIFFLYYINSNGLVSDKTYIFIIITIISIALLMHVGVISKGNIIFILKCSALISVILGSFDLISGGFLFGRGCDRTPVVVNVPKSTFILEPGCEVVLDLNQILKWRREMTGLRSPVYGVSVARDSNNTIDNMSVSEEELFTLSKYYNAAGGQRIKVISRTGLKSPIRLYAYERSINF